MGFHPDWAIADDLTTILIKHFREHNPSVVVEFGSGRSTVLMGGLLGDDGSLVSFEQSDAFAAETGEAIKRSGQTIVTSLVVAPIVDGWYHPEVVDTILDGYDQIDLVLVDGPGPCLDRTRRPAVAAVYDRLSDDARIIVDDADHLPAGRDLEAWLEEFPDLVEQYVPTDRGTVILRKTQ